MEKKTTIKFFSILEYGKEQAYLRKMHQNGWRLTKITGVVYQFEKCTPKDTIYQIDYNRDGLAHKDEYVKMFQDCGWEYLQDCLGYSYFRKSASEAVGAEEIFCDDDSRMQMFHRVFKGKMIPLLVLFICFLIPGLIRNLTCHEYFVATMLGLAVCAYLVIFTTFAYRYFKFKTICKR